METFLNEKTRNALHSYTHAGLQQLGRSDPLHDQCSVHGLKSNHFQFEDDWKNVTEMYIEWGKN